MSALLAPRRTLPGAEALLIATVIGGLIALFAGAFSTDPLFRLQAMIFAAASIPATFVLTAGLSSGQLLDEPDRYMDGPIRAGVIATMFWAIIGMLVGVFVALQLCWPTIF